MGTRSKGEQGKTGLLCCAIGLRSRQGGASVRFLPRAFAHFPRVLSHTPSEHTGTRHSGRKRPARWRFPTLDCSWRACRPPLRPMALGRQQPKGTFCPLGCEKKYGKRGGPSWKKGRGTSPTKRKRQVCASFEKEEGVITSQIIKNQLLTRKVFWKNRNDYRPTGLFLKNGP